MHTVTLTKVWRQEDNILSLVLNRVRTATQTKMDLKFINSRVVAEPPFDAIVLTPFRRDVKEINERKLNAHKSQPYTLAAKKTGRGKGDKSLLPEMLNLKHNCRVVVNRNCRCRIGGVEQTVPNGTTGIFRGFDSRERLLLLRDGKGDVVPIKRYEDSVYSPPKFKDGQVTCSVTAKIKQYPVQLGYALTIHSCQGLTLNRVHLHLPPPERMMRFAGLIYVALSRIKDLSGLSLNRPLLNSDIVSIIPPPMVTTPNLPAFGRT